MNKLNDVQINENLTQLKDWRCDGQSIQKEWQFKDFIEAVGFLNKVAILSEKHNHHAEIFNVYNKVKLKFFTHTVNGLTDKDFAIAKDIDSLE